MEADRHIRLEGQFKSELNEFGDLGVAMIEARAAPA